jgi:hypothetical protein
VNINRQQNNYFPYILLEKGRASYVQGHLTVKHSIMKLTALIHFRIETARGGGGGGGGKSITLCILVASETSNIIVVNSAIYLMEQKVHTAFIITLGPIYCQI